VGAPIAVESKTRSTLKSSRPLALVLLLVALCALSVRADIALDGPWYAGSAAATVGTPSFSPNNTSAAWQSSGPLALPVGARIRIVWSLTGSGGAANDYLGWYIDDVVVASQP